MSATSGTSPVGHATQIFANYLKRGIGSTASVDGVSSE
jgi:hypothetical protein